MKNQTIAYLCAEFALDSALPTYAGGLGVLAGDIVMEANLQNTNLIAIGLFYRLGYTGDNLTQAQTPQEHRLEKVATIKIPIEDHYISVRCWKKQQETIPVYFLDTFDSSNSETDRKITDILYPSSSEIKLKQEIVLGIGALKLLEALNIHPRIYHLNEGHSAFLVLGLIRHEMIEHKINFDQARDMVRQKVVFTNHTLLPAGNEVYSSLLVSSHLKKYSEQIQVPVDQLIAPGLIPRSNDFSLTLFCLRLAGRTNAVSHIHSQKAAGIWPHHPMLPITNGIFIPRWDRLLSSDPANIWTAHQQCKKTLLEYIAKQTGHQWPVDVPLIGWARRIVSYKRPTAILQDPNRLTTLNANFVFSGKTHSADETGLQLFNQMAGSISSISKSAVFLPEYSLDLAALLTAGCDVWLNTPVVGFEACGTSGMKACLNGVLPLTTNDGWIGEVDLSNIGWLADDTDITGSLLSLLKDQIIPEYAIRPSWIRRQLAARQLIFDHFSTTHTLSEYQNLLYNIQS